jgi:hypothetical protein
MKNGFIRNREGRIIGRMDGNWLCDGTGKLAAKYDLSDGKTRTREGKIVGNGDLRLFQPEKTNPINEKLHRFLWPLEFRSFRQSKRLNPDADARRPVQQHQNRR